MGEKETLKKIAELYRESADILDEMSEETDEEKVDELMAKYVVKTMKLQELAQ